MNNILYLNKKLYQSNLSESPLCSFCKNHDEDTIHLFSDCTLTGKLWDDLSCSLYSKIRLPQITPQSAILGFHENDNLKLTINHILLIFKCYIYKSRPSGVLTLNKLLKSIRKVVATEEKIASENTNQKLRHREKYGTIAQT